MSLSPLSPWIAGPAGQRLFSPPKQQDEAVTSIDSIDEDKMERLTAFKDRIREQLENGWVRYQDYISFAGLGMNMDDFDDQERQFAINDIQRESFKIRVHPPSYMGAEDHFEQTHLEWQDSRNAFQVMFK